MLFSHISDTHLGLIQYGSNEREEDVYDVFNQAIDKSIKDNVDFVIFAGDIFHIPTPNGSAIVQMGNALKRLKENNIDSFFILGEHDISRIRTTPIPYIYHNLGFSKYIGDGNPIEYKGIMLAGFDKIRKTEMSQYEEVFSNLDKSVEKSFQVIRYWYYIKELQNSTNLQGSCSQQIYQKISHIMQWDIYMIKISNNSII